MSAVPSLILPVHIGPTALKRFEEAGKTIRLANWQLPVSKLVADIRTWKVITPQNTVETKAAPEFGRDCSNNRDDFAYAWHAHMEPPSKLSRAAWKANALKAAQDRTSDYCLIYSLDPDDAKYGLLVLDVVGEVPSGHRIWGPSFNLIRPGWEKAAKKHQKEGWLPPNTVTY